MEYKRQCANWLTDFGRWSLPRSEAPETYIFWTGLFALSSALRRHVSVTKDYLGSWECGPNLYIMFVADPGKARKTTTTFYAEELFERLELDHKAGITMAPDLITKESLLSTLVKSPDQSMCILSGEFGEFIVKSGVEMYSFLTNAYDGKKKLSASTLSRGLEFASKPCVNLLGATTPAWLADNMPESVIGGGFASRTIFIFEESVRHRQMYYESLDYRAIDALGARLAEDLAFIATEIHGPFEIDEPAKIFMEKWYKDNADAGTAAQYKLHGYFERRPAHIHKIAMLIHLAYDNDRVILKPDFERAIILLKQIEQKLPKTFQAVGRNPYTIDMGRILEFVKENKRVTKQELFSQFFHIATPSVLQELLDGLLAMQLLQVEVNGNKSFIVSGGVSVS